MQLQTVCWAHVTFVNMPVKLILIIHSSMKSGALLCSSAQAEKRTNKAHLLSMSFGLCTEVKGLGWWANQMFRSPSPHYCPLAYGVRWPRGMSWLGASESVKKFQVPPNNPQTAILVLSGVGGGG